MVIKDPTITIEELMAAAADAGQNFKSETAAAARRMALEFISVARKAGHWQD
jgi:hypothetical protein